MSTQQRIEAESYKDPDELEREIEMKRSEIGGIISALEHKLSPGEIIDRVLRTARGNSGEFFGNLGDTIKANPVPAVLTSVGLLWLMVGPTRPAFRTGSARIGASSEDWRAAETASSLKQRAGGLKQQAQERASEMKDDMSERLEGLGHRASELGHRASDTAHQAADSVRHSAQQAGESIRHSAQQVRQGAQQVRHSMDDLLAEQPIAVAAIGMAAGALLAALLPTTRSEQELLGQASQRVRQQASELAQSGMQQAREFAESGARQAEEFARSGVHKADQAIDEQLRRRGHDGGGTESKSQRPGGTAH